MPRSNEVFAKRTRPHPRDLVGKVKTKVKEVIVQVDRLVMNRTTEHEQREYLSKMGGDFQELCKWRVLIVMARA